MGEAGGSGAVAKKLKHKLTYKKNNTQNKNKNKKLTGGEAKAGCGLR